MDLNQLMTRETAELTAPPRLLRDVRAGGRRRQLRRRVVVSVTVATALVGAGLVVVPALLTRSEPTRFAGPLFDGATHGDLAGDTGYVNAAIAAWTHSHETSANRSRGLFNDLRGEPRVVWAGTTPGGNAAVVAQDAYLHRHGDIQLDHEGLYQLLGFVGPGGDGNPRIVGDTYPSPDGLAETAWYVDDARTVVAAFSANGDPVGFSSGWRYGHDGSAAQSYAPMRDEDGVGIAAVRSGDRPAVARLPYRSLMDEIVILGGPPRASEPDRLPWTGVRLLNGATKPRPSAFQVLGKLLEQRRTGALIEFRGGSWSVAANVGGHAVLVAEAGLDQDPTRTYAVVDGRTVLDAGFIDPAAPLPVQVRLPDQLGFVVVRYGAALAYREVKGNWVDAGRDAALVPDTAGAVRVRVSGEPDRVVSLYRTD